MNLYVIYKRNTIDNVPEMNALLDDTRDYCHRRGCTMSHVQTFQAI